MKTLKVLYNVSLFVGTFLLVSGLIMKYFMIGSHGWFFTKRGELHNGALDENGTLILAFIVLAFSIWFRKSYKQEKQNHDRLKNIESNEQKLKHKYNIYKLRKLNKH